MILTIVQIPLALVKAEDDRIKDLIVLDGGKPETSESTELHYMDIPVTEFQVSDLSPETVTDLDYSDWWYSEWEDCRYLFLPATADRERLTICYSAGDVLYLDNKPVASGESTALTSDRIQLPSAIASREST